MTIQTNLARKAVRPILRGIRQAAVLAHEQQRQKFEALRPLVRDMMRARHYDAYKAGAIGFRVGHGSYGEWSGNHPEPRQNTRTIDGTMGVLIARGATAEQAARAVVRALDGSWEVAGSAELVCIPQEAA